ncbi:MAG TPA: COX15/CtaA family protein [Candidatus Micrarchaeia archaeon]|nr:COX15/CtaA family protein [Candidatus Micrarchaeia archaeon]
MRAGPAGPGSTAATALARSALATAVATYVLVILGSTVRVTESGMGCPGWPLCYGQLGPIDRFHSAVEQTHRYVVVVVTVLVLLTAALAWFAARRRRSVLWPATAAAVVIVVQIALGAVTVITHNAPITVALHLLTAQLLLALVTVVAVTARTATRAAGAARLPWLGWAAVAATFVLLVAGSLVVDGGATYACPSWPACGLHGEPAALVAIQYVHRGAVLVVGIILAVFVMRAARGWRHVAGSRWVADLIGAAFLAEVAVGGLSATLRAPEGIQDLHLALAAVIWVGVVALATLGWQAGVASAPPGPRAAVEGVRMGADMVPGS